MKRFLPDLKKGTPVGSKGVREGLLRMAKALERMGVHNGRIQWANGIPTIIVETEEGVAGTDFPEGEHDGQMMHWDDANGEWAFSDKPDYTGELLQWDGDDWNPIDTLDFGTYNYE